MASIPRTAELRLLGTSMDIKVGTTAELDSWPTSPPKGDRDMNVGVELSFPDVLAEMFEAPTLPNMRLDAMVAVDSGPVTTDVTLLPGINPGRTTEEGPGTTAVTLFAIMVDDSDP